MRIAICDDEKEIRELYAEKVRQLYPHADLVQYQSGEELLMAERKPDILLFDIQMPGRNGMDTARQLRRVSRDVVIIFAYKGIIKLPSESQCAWFCPDMQGRF